jgi:uncharacterized protein (DUF2384 family)
LSPAGGSEHANDRATLKIYGSIADKLNLSVAERCAVLGVDHQTYDRWQANPAAIELSGNHIERSSELIDVYNGLLRLFGDRELASSWLRVDNHDFGGKPPLEALLSADTAQFRSVFDYIMSILVFRDLPIPSEN